MKNQKPSVYKRLSDKGREIISKIPRTVNIKIRRPVSEHQRFRQWLDAESKSAAMKGQDSYEEFMDFGVDSPDTPRTEFELVFDPRTGREMYPKEKAWLDAQRAEYDKRQRAMAKHKTQKQEAELTETIKPAPKKKTPKTDEAE